VIDFAGCEPMLASYDFTPLLFPRSGQVAYFSRYHYTPYASEQGIFGNPS
jgi:hypothetical protein